MMHFYAISGDASRRYVLFLAHHKLRNLLGTHLRIYMQLPLFI